MLDENVMPNEVTILGVLNGCSHSGLVEEGSSIWDNRKACRGLHPRLSTAGATLIYLVVPASWRGRLKLSESSPWNQTLLYGGLC